MAKSANWRGRVLKNDFVGVFGIVFVLVMLDLNIPYRMLFVNYPLWFKRMRNIPRAISKMLSNPTWGLFQTMFIYYLDVLNLR